MAKKLMGARVDESLYRAVKLRAKLEGRTVEVALAILMLQYLNEPLPDIMPGYAGTYLEYRKALQAIEEID